MNLPAEKSETTVTKESHPLVIIETSKGDVKVELNEDKAPETVKNFLAYVDGKFYEHTIFHRVIEDFMIQGGSFTIDLKEKVVRPPIKNEATNGLKNEIGTIAMARTSDPNSAKSQFFINVADNNGLDHPRPDGHGYAVFGKVVDGMNVVDRIKRVKTGINKGMRDVPVETIEIIHVRRVENGR